MQTTRDQPAKLLKIEEYRQIARILIISLPDHIRETINSMGKIILEGMEFFAYHGCFKEEQLIGTKFIVDIEVEADTSAAEQSDHLADTINYVSLYQLVKTEMDQKSHLLEHVAGRIMQAIRSHFPAISCIDLKISKLNPPVGGKMAQIGFSTSWKKQ